MREGGVMLQAQTKRIWDTPLYADFPRSEYEDRVRRARGYMAERELDALVMWDAANIRYFSGFHSLHWSSLSISPAVYLLPLEREPIIVVPDFFSGVAQGYTYLEDIRLQPKPHITKNIRQIPVDIADTLKDLGCGRGRIGLESGWLGGMAALRPFSDIDRFRAELADATFVDACDLIWKCRAIKSASEVEALKQATQAIVAAYGEVVSSFQLGMSERDVGRLLRSAILERTEDCTPPIATASSRRIPMPDTPSFYDEVTLSVGDRLVFEPLPSYKGYYGSCCRCFQIGPLPDEARRKAEGVDRAQAAAIAAIKPGVQAKHLLDVIDHALRDEGMDSTIEMAGHGVGLNTQEPPMIAEEEESAFEEGMVLAVEVWVVDWTGLSLKGANASSVIPQVYGNEDLVVVTRDGCDRFPSFRRDIRSLPHEGRPG
jgi:Xaa-Pro aminopeptidase